MAFTWLRRKRSEEEEPLFRNGIRQKQPDREKSWNFVPGHSPFEEYRKYGRQEKNPAEFSQGADSGALAAWIRSRREELFPRGPEYGEMETETVEYLEDLSGYLKDIKDAWSACGKLQGDGGYLEEIMHLEEDTEQLAGGFGNDARRENLLNQNMERYNFLHRQIEQLAGSGQLRAAAGILERAAGRMDRMRLPAIPGLYWVWRKLRLWLQEMIRELKTADRKVFGKRIQNIHEKFISMQEIPPGDARKEDAPAPDSKNKTAKDKGEETK